MPTSALSSPASGGPESGGRGDSSDSPDPQSWLARVLARLRRQPRPSIRASLTDTLAGPVAGQDSFSPKEWAMLRNILTLRERRVDEAMAPRADIVAVPEDVSLADLMTRFREAGRSRLPVYRGTLDDPVGMVHVKDLMSFLLSGGRLEGEKAARDGQAAELQEVWKIDLDRPLSSTPIVRPVLFTTPATPALDLLAEMQKKRSHMALVVDEYGGTDGLVTIEDLIEQVVGDIRDEHDSRAVPMIMRRANGDFVADARASLKEVSAAIGLDLERAGEAEDVETLGGLIVALAGHVPARGETIPGPDDLEFEILDADSRRIKRVGMRRRAHQGDGPPPAPSEPPSAENDDYAEGVAVTSRSLGRVENSSKHVLASEGQER